MLNYKNILIAVDGSTEAEWAYNKAVAVAKRNDAKLTIVNVVDSRSYASVEAYDTQIVNKASSFAESLLLGYKENAEKHGVTNVATKLSFGSPKTIIPKKLANEFEVDLIMCGTSGLNAVERFIVGSVSESIVRNAPCDVLVIRTETMPEDFEPVVATQELFDSHHENAQ